MDSWFSDYAVGDLMERTVKVKLDPEKISTIDAIYISHAHSDHFDPYTLVEIYRSCHVDDRRHLAQGQTGKDFSSSITETDGLCRNDKKPLLIVPFTLRYLEPLLTEYLPSARVHWL
jgi:ribonuclease BN (tRNA processing enzyme)